jgi:DNA end-binding protein Ku
MRRLYEAPGNRRMASESKATSRALWKGVIRLGAASLPVKLYSAVSDHAVHFHWLHAPDRVRVVQRWVSSETGAEVESDDAVRGYPIGPEQWALLSRDELASLAPEKSRDVAVSRFVPSSALAPAYYDRPYHLGPDGDAAGYLALAAALAKRDEIGIARWAMRGAHRVGALRARDGGLSLHTLRHRDEVVSAAQLDAPQGRPSDARERALAEQLVAALDGDADLRDFREEYQDRVRALAEAKARGRKPKLAPLPPARRAAPLASALERSVAAAKRRAHG